MWGATIIDLKIDLQRELGDVHARLPDYLRDLAHTSGRLSSFRIVAAVIGVTLAACTQNGEGSLFHRFVFGGTRQIKDVQPVDGFLPDPTLLRPGRSGQAALVYRNPTANFARYNKIFLDPATIWTAPDSALSRAPESTREAAANRFYGDLYEALSRHCVMVTSLSRRVNECRHAAIVIVNRKIGAGDDSDVLLAGDLVAQ